MRGTWRIWSAAKHERGEREQSEKKKIKRKQEQIVGSLGAGVEKRVAVGTNKPTTAGKVGGRRTRDGGCCDGVMLMRPNPNQSVFRNRMPSGVIRMRA